MFCYDTTYLLSTRTYDRPQAVYQHRSTRACHHFCR